MRDENLVRTVVVNRCWGRGVDAHGQEEDVEYVNGRGR